MRFDAIWLYSQAVRSLRSEIMMSSSAGLNASDCARSPSSTPTMNVNGASSPQIAAAHDGMGAGCTRRLVSNQASLRLYGQAGTGPSP